MSTSRKWGIRRQMTPNQVVAYNVAKARALRGWTQERAAEALEPYLGTKLSSASFSALERSAWVPTRIKQFSADDLLALSRGFELPIPWFLIPPPAVDDIGLYTPDTDMQGQDPLLLLDAVLGTAESQADLERSLLEYAAGIAPPPKSRRHRQNLQPAGLADRAQDVVRLRARALVRGSLGDLAGARDVLERLAEILEELDRPEPAGTNRQATARGRSDQTTRRSTTPPAKKGGR